MLDDLLEGVFQSGVSSLNELSQSLRVLNTILPLSQQPVGRLLSQNIVVTLVRATGIVVIPQFTQIRSSQVTVTTTSFSSLLDCISCRPRHKRLGTRDQCMNLRHFNCLQGEKINYFPLSRSGASGNSPKFQIHCYLPEIFPPYSNRSESMRPQKSSKHMRLPNTGISAIAEMRSIQSGGFGNQQVSALSYVQLIFNDWSFWPVQIWSKLLSQCCIPDGNDDRV